MKHCLLLLLLGASLTSCYHAYYAPNSTHAALLSAKGESRINGTYTAGADTEFEGVELQAAHALTNHSGIMLNFMSVGRTDNTGSQVESGKGSYLEVAYGGFKPLDKRGGQWIGEIYGGLGRGAARNEYSAIERSKVGITKFFVQPAIGYKSRYFEAALVPRLALVNWKVKESVLAPDNAVAGDLNIIRGNPTFFSFEPGILLRAGSQNIKFQAGLSFCMNKYNSGNYLFYDEGLSETLTANLGISISLFPAKK